jgi:hypothetical protein
MVVYVLLQSNALEGGDEFCGLYSSAELAKAAAEAREKPTSEWREDGTADCGPWVQWTIEKAEVDDSERGEHLK